MTHAERQEFVMNSEWGKSVLGIFKVDLKDC